MYRFNGGAFIINGWSQELWVFGGNVAGTYQALLNDLWRYRVNDSTWTWMSGSNTTDQQGFYGEIGVASTENVPGARVGAVGCYDSSRQEFWLFGGLSFDAYGCLDTLNDLWIYRVNDSTWTWMGGSDTINDPGDYGVQGEPSSTNVPGSRTDAVGWYDSSRQEFWVFGGYGFTKEFVSGYLNDLWRYRVSDNTWTWISGSNTINLPGFYGEKGNASTDNVPGARRFASGWYDSTNQEFWLFGGEGLGSSMMGLLNDLWRYRVNDSTWTWFSGSGIPTQPGLYGEKGNGSSENVPGSRQSAVVWYDSLREEFWLFGGKGYASTISSNLNDLWLYRVNNDTWTWMAGSSEIDDLGQPGQKGTENIPGARYGAFGYYDDATGQLWLFGGHNEHHYNSHLYGATQLWRYNTTDSTWTWVSGVAVSGKGVYGEQGEANNTNIPGARMHAVSCYDSSTQELWLFGGFGFGDNDTIIGYLNDLWRYRVNDNTWTWISGSNTPDQPGIYGEQGIADTTNIPGSRHSGVAWCDSSRQEFWLFGGYGWDRNDNIGLLNDLWRYRMNDSTWTWMSGSNSTNQPGVYGEKGNPNASNVPGARYEVVGWYDSLRQELWFFGGYGYGNDSTTIGGFNDLWRYSINSNTWTWIAGSDTPDQAGVYGERGIANTTNSPGARRNAIGCYDSSAEEFWLFGGYGIGNFTIAEYGLLNDLWRYRVNDSTWTWIAGSGSVDQPGKYGTQATASIDNAPGSRENGVGWYDGSRQEFWLFGGYSKTESEGFGILNDLWRYRVNDSTWTWFSGSKVDNQHGQYGDKGNASSGNVPGSRYGSVAWYDSSTRELWLFGGNTTFGAVNDVWKATLLEPASEEPTELVCPPLHHNINNTCIPDFECFSSEDGNSNCTLECEPANGTTDCILECSNGLASDSESNCVIEGDVVLNGSLVETPTLIIVGVINVTGDVTIIGSATLKLSPAGTLHIGKCLVLDEAAQVVVEVEHGVMNGSVLLTFDSSCSSSPRWAERVKIESRQTMEEMCLDGRPTVRAEEVLGEGGMRRTQLTLVFELMSESDECNANSSGSDLKVVAIAVSVAIVVLVLVVIIVVMSVRKIRKKVVPGSMMLSKQNNK